MPTIESIVREINKDLAPRFEKNGSIVINGILVLTTKETKGHEGKKNELIPLCTFVTLRG